MRVIFFCSNHSNLSIFFSEEIIAIIWKAAFFYRDFGGLYFVIIVLGRSAFACGV